MVENGCFPRFKKKDINDSVALRESAKFDVIGRELRLEKLKTRIEMRQPLRFQGVTKQVTISKCAGKYFVSILVETEDYNPNDADKQASVGVNFGIKELAVFKHRKSVFGKSKAEGKSEEISQTSA